MITKFHSMLQSKVMGFPKGFNPFGRAEGEKFFLYTKKKEIVSNLLFR